MTGDRFWNDPITVYSIVAALSKLEEHFGQKLIVVHGACRGADELADEAAETFGADPKPYPAKWLVYGYGAGPIRNQLMIDDNPDVALVVAFHNDIKKSRGTKDMLKRALTADIPAILYSNDKVFIVTEDLLD